MQLEVRFSKYFTKGSYKGQSKQASALFADLDKASAFVSWCHKHKDNPVVSPLETTEYTIFGARIVCIDAGDTQL